MRLKPVNRVGLFELRKETPEPDKRDLAGCDGV